MLDLRITTKTGRLADLVQSMRDVPERVMPYAAATALTRTASALAKTVLPGEMQRVFDRPNAYTLNSLRSIGANRQTLTAAVWVKDDATNNGTRPEDYLLPNVASGGRNEKRFERAMRYAGLLPAGWRAMPGQAAPLDPHGNLRRGEIQRILTATRTAFDPAQRKTSSARSRKSARNAPYFGVTPFVGRFTGGEYRQTKSHLQPGVYRREGRSIRPVLIFTNTQPQYRQRLDFVGISERYTLEHFPAEFNRAAQAILSRPRSPR
jgi:hypothetical protein